MKSTIFIASITAGLITPENNNQVYQNRLLPEQELKIFEDTDRQVRLPILI